MAQGALPQLREELSLLPGPHLPDGQPTWTLQDPVRNLFFQLDWASFEMLCRWHCGDSAQIVGEVNAETTLRVSAVDVEQLGLFLQQNQLLVPAAGSSGRLAAILRQRKGSFGQWLLHHYLFLRIPLLRPDHWLGRWVGHLDWFYSATFFRLTVLAGGLGLLGVYREWAHFSTTLVDMLTWQGALAYGLTLTAVKVLHELAHGFTAKRHGCRVPTMGVAFLVLWPVAYTDTNEVWKLTSRRQRLEVAAAGIVIELIVAVWATLAWVWLPAGLPKSIAFLLATTTWVSTIAINASPFMRFDGYFLLSDALQLPNLHTRAFALARWDLRERLFALGESVPEHFPKARHAGLIMFAWATWVYRLVLFLGIAALVYHFFIKAVGIFLFLVEIGWFVLLPFGMEIRAWQQRWPSIRGSRRARRSGVVAALVVLLFLLPWPSRVTTSAIVLPQEQLLVYAPLHAQIVGLPVANNTHVDAGAALVQMQSPDLLTRGEQAQARREQLLWQSSSAVFDVEQRKSWQVLGEQLAGADAEEQAVQADAARYHPVAPYPGVWLDMDPELRVGDWVANRELLGRLVSDGAMQVVSYVDDDEINRIHPGDRALFAGEGGWGPTLFLEVVSLDRDASRTLNEPELASVFGGHIQVREKGGLLYPERAVYRVVLKVLDAAHASREHTWRGQLSIAGEWVPPGVRFLKTALSVLRREAGF